MLESRGRARRTLFWASSGPASRGIRGSWALETEIQGRRLVPSNQGKGRLPEGSAESVATPRPNTELLLPGQTSQGASEQVARVGTGLRLVVRVCLLAE